MTKIFTIGSTNLSSMKKYSLVSLIFLLGLFNSNRGFGATLTYNIDLAGVTYQSASCGNGVYTNCVAGSQMGLTWTDAVPAGSTVTAVAIQIVIGVECSAAAHPWYLNGVAQGSYTPASNGCSCTTVSNGVVTLNASAANYVRGGSNTFKITQGSSCLGFNPSVGGSHYGVVTVTYSCPAPVAGTLTQTPASGSSVCQGTNVHYAISGNSGYTSEYFQYQWNATPPNSGSWGISGNGTNAGDWASGPNGGTATLYVNAVLTNACGTSTTNTVAVVIDANTVAGTLTQAPASGGHVCNGTNVGYSISGNTYTSEYYQYAWNSSTPNSGSWGISGNGTNAGTWPSGLDGGGPSVLYVDAVVQNGVCPAVTTNVVNVEVDAFTAYPTTATQTQCLGATATALSVGAYTNPANTYQWYRNYTASNSGGDIVTGTGTNATYTPPTTAAGTTYFYCVLGGVCTSAVSGPVVVDQPVAVISPTTSSVCQGGTVALTASGGSSYQWSGGSTANTAAITAGTGTYTVVATDANSCTASVSRVITQNMSPSPVALTGTTTIGVCGTTQLTSPWTAATGGAITTANGYTIHTFTSGTSTFASNSVTNAEVLAVGGGGGGAPSIGGGGGGGGVIYESNQPFAANTNYSVTVGAGGAGGPSQQTFGSNGGASTISTIGLTAAGGGGGAWYNDQSGLNGGCGGGAGGSQGGTPTGGLATGSSLGSGATGTIYGNKGGSVVDPRNNFCPTSAAGGGGAGYPAFNVEDADPNSNRAGGAGVAFNISGTQYYYGGGGGGGTYCISPALNPGGLGGGGGGSSTSGASGGAGGTGGINNGAAGSAGANVNGGAAGANTGGGGGGGSWSSDAGGAGGSGVVIIRYPTLSGGTWTSDNTAVATVSSTGLVTGVSNGTAHITYAVTSCSITNSVSTTITVNGLTSQPSAAAQTKCLGGTFAPLTVTAAGSPTYQWYRNYTASTSGGDIVNGTGNTSSYTPPTNAAGTTYFYCIINGCYTTSLSGAFVVDQPVATISPSTSSVCQGGTVALTASGGSSYQWSGGSSATTAGITAGAGSYTVVVTDANSCTASTTRVITQNAVPAPNSITGSTTICAGLTSQLTSPFTAATGGTVTTGNGYTIHTFTATGATNFVTTSGLNAEVLVVGGGGGGGSSIAGGGGGGGVVYESSQPFTGGNTYVVTVGAGGAGGVAYSSGSYIVCQGSAGGSSTIAGGGLTQPVVAAGGGGGGSFWANASSQAGGNGVNGGSGGGGGGTQAWIPNTGGTATGSALGTGGVGTIYGNAGGGVVDLRYNFCNVSGAGGGGAGAAAFNVEVADPNANRAGGNGVAFNISGTQYYYGGGGGAGTYCQTTANNSGGLGGGGGGGTTAGSTAGAGGTGGINNGAAGGVGNNSNGGAGGANTGGGGGGGPWNVDNGGAGGSGVVIIRYPTLTGGTWTSSNPSVATVNSTTGLVTAVNAGTTTITYAVTSCSVTTSVTTTVTVNPAVTATVTPTSAGTYCSYSNTGILSVTAGAGTPGYTYLWSNGLGSGTTASPTSTSPTSYGVTVTDNVGCTASASTGAITVDAVTVSPTPAANTKLCSYATSSALGAGASGGATPYAYAWNNGLGTSSTATPTITTGTVYSVLVTDHNGCTVTGNTGSISIDALVTAVASPGGTTTYCPYATSGVLSVVPGGGTGVYTYAWSNSLGSSATATPTSTSVIVYTVTVTDNNGCTAISNTGSVNVDPAMTASPTPSSTKLYCSYNNASGLVANAGGGSLSYTYNWSAGLGTGATATPVSATGTVYTVTITDTKGCTITGNTGLVTVDPVVTVSPTPNSATFYCSYQNSGVLHANPAGGSGTYSLYAWSGGLGSGATASPTIGAASAYSVTVTDNVGCTASATTGVITVNPTLTSVPTPTAATFYCSYSTSNALNAVPGGGTSPYTYVWSNGLGTAITATPITATAQSYSVTVTDHNLCTALGTSGVITVDPVLTATPTANGVNNGGTTYVCSYSNTNALAAGAAGGTPGYTYLWNNSLGTGATATPTLTSGTTYTVTVTDNKNCTASSSVGPVVDYAPPSINGTTPGSICGTGTVNLGASSTAGVVNWWPASTGGTAPSANTGGSYTTPIISTSTNFWVDATSNGCTTQTRTSVLATVYPTVISSGGFYYSTSSNYATILASGTQVVSTNPVNAGIVKQDISGLLPCTTYYYVTYIVTNGVTEYASTAQSFTTGNSPATIGLTSGGTTNSQSICTSGTITDITYAIGGGGSGATFSGLPAGINGTFTAGVAKISGSTNVAPGSYPYTVQTTGTCAQTSASGTITITAQPALTAPTPASEATCASTATGGISVTPSGGAGTITYQWYSSSSNVLSGGTNLGSANGAQTTTYTPPTTATLGTTYYYCVMSASASGCPASTVVANASNSVDPVVSNYGTIVASAGANQSLCANVTPSGTFTVTGATGGSGVFSYQWYYQAGLISAPSGAVPGSWLPCDATMGTGYNTATFAPAGTAANISYACAVTPAGGAPSCAGATTWASGDLQMTVAAPTASISGGNVQVCQGASVTLNANTIFVATWQWYSSPDNVTFTPISSATSTTYVPSTSTPGLAYYNAIATYSTGSGCTPATSNSESVSVSPPPAVSAPTTTSICTGGSNTLTLTASGGVAPPTTYQWQYFNGVTWSNIVNNTPTNMTYTVNSSGQTSTITFSTTTSIATGTFLYRGRVSFTGTGCTPTVTSNSGNLIIQQQPVASTITPNVPVGAVCAGQTLSASFNSASGGSGTIVDVYEFSIDGGSTYNPYAQNQGISTTSLSGQTVIIRSSRTATGSGCSTSPYKTVTWNVIAQPVAATITPNVPAGSVCTGQPLSATFSGASGGSGTVADVYQYSTDGGTTFNTYTGGQAISTTALTGQTVVIQSSRTATGTGCNTSAFNTLSWTVVAQPVSATITPNVPAGNVCAGQSLSATFSGASGGSGTITDVYEYSIDGGSTFNPYTSGHSISTGALAGTDVVVRSSRTATGSDCNTSTYNTVTWNVIAQPVASAITPNIAGGLVCDGQSVSATFAGGSGGSGTVTDVYEYSLNGGGTFSTYVPSTPLSTTGLTGQTVIIRSSRTSTGTGCSTSGYNTVNWSVTANPSITATNSGPFCNYSTITVVANPSGYTDYKWSGPNGFGPVDGMQQTLAANGNGGTYTVTVSNSNGCTSTASTNVTVVGTIPATASNAGPYCVTDNIILTSGPTVSGYGYRWAGPHSYTSTQQDPAGFIANGNAGTYTVIVTDGNGCSASASTDVSVYPGTSVTASNTGPFVVGQTIGLSANSSDAVSYAWAGPNGYTGSGQTTSIPGATLAMAGTYTVTATNGTGCTSSASTTVVVTTTANYTWTGTTGSDWTDPTNWVPTAPVGGPNACAIDVTIPNVAHSPIISGVGISVGNLQMNSGSQLTLSGVNISVCKDLTGGSGGHAAVIGDGVVVLTGSTLQTFTGYFSMQELMLSNSAGASMLSNSAVDLYTSLDLQTGNFDATNGTLTFKSNTVDSVAILDNFSQHYTGTITGNITAERYYATSTTQNQHYMGSPINSPSLANQFGASGTGGGSHVLDTYCDETQTNYNSPYGTVFKMNQIFGSNCGIEQWVVETSGNAQNGLGYSLLKPGSGKLVLNGQANLDENYQISGLQNGGWSNTTMQSRPQTSGWQLLSNPYLATLDITTVPTGFDNQIEIWNAEGLYAGTYQPGLIGTNAVIAPFQGFMVHKTAVGGLATFTINGSDRVRAPATFYQQNANELKIIAANTATGLLDQTTVAFNSAASDTFDAVYDAQKMAGSLSRHTIYSLNNNKWLSRNTLHDIETTSTVPVGFEPGKTGTFKFSFNGVNTFDPTSYIYLEDRALNIMYNVRNSDYTFNADSADGWNRFVLHFTPAAQINTVNATCSAGGTINIQQPGNANWNYTLTDSTSSVVAHGTLNQTQPVTVQAATGTYTLTLTDTNNYVAVKTIQVNGPVPVSAAFMVSADTVIPEQTVVLVANTQDAASYQWDFGNGMTGTGSEAMVSYTQPGVYVLSLLVTNDAGCSSTQTHSVTVAAPSSTTGLNNITGTGNISIWSNANRVYVDFTSIPEVDATVAIYNVLGQEISQEHYSNSNIYQREIDGIEAAYMIVMVRNADKITTRKVLITNSH